MDCRRETVHDGSDVDDPDYTPHEEHACKLRMSLINY